MNVLIKIGLLLSLAIAVLPAAELDGIWTGLAPGRNGTKQDVAFQFEMHGQAVTGTLFGDEFDLPIEEASATADQIRFSVTTTNYYSGSKVKFLYSGVVKGDSMELTRERLLKPGEKPPEKEALKQSFVLKRLVHLDGR
jgi:hypothetical protein